MVTDDPMSEIQYTIALMRGRLDSGQGTLQSAMCRLSLPMAYQLLHAWQDATRDYHAEHEEVERLELELVHAIAEQTRARAQLLLGARAYQVDGLTAEADSARAGESAALDEVARLRAGIASEAARLEHACTIHDRDRARARLLALLGDV